MSVGLFQFVSNKRQKCWNNEASTCVVVTHLTEGYMDGRNFKKLLLKNVDLKTVGNPALKQENPKNCYLQNEEERDDIYYIYRRKKKGMIYIIFTEGRREGWYIK